MIGEAPAARLRGVSLKYGGRLALDGVDLDVPSGETVGLIGPDGVGKSSLLALIAGARAVQQGSVEALGGDMAGAAHRRAVAPRIAFMPQGLGRNLYPTLSVAENVDVFARLFGLNVADRRRRIAALTAATGLAPFRDRPAGKLSGGMRQKLGLCCALVHDPDLLILDEPTTGVDPLARRQFWELIDRMRRDRPGMTVLAATAYMEEAERFDRLVAMDAGRVLAVEAPSALRSRTGAATLEDAFVALLPAARTAGRAPVVIPPRPADADGEAVIRARGLTMRFDDFTAVDDVDLDIGRGEIFGFLGSNGCGKTTTMKMLAGLLAPSAGEAWLFGQRVRTSEEGERRRVGYMSQSFSLNQELTVAQNLALHARLFGLPAADIPGRIAELAARFDLAGHLDALPEALPLGHRQRLSLAVALVHRPEVLILDEPTSGVDPLARDAFWRSLVDLARRDGVTIFISTHFMNEAGRCDRIALMHAGRVLAVGAPAALARQRGAATLEDAFIGYLRDAGAGAAIAPGAAGFAATPASAEAARPLWCDPRRILAYAYVETLSLRRDPIRLLLALVGSGVLLVFMGYGLSMDVDGLRFAVLDWDRTGASQRYASDIAGSRYFIEEAPLADHADIDRRMRAGEISLAIEIPPGFARDIARGRPVAVGAWVDGAMPVRAETIQGYVAALHADWLGQRAVDAGRPIPPPPATIEVRYRYNPDVRSIVAMAPAIIPILLIMMPAMLTALAVAREKELGSIVNFYVTPTTRLEFLLGKQAPYVAVSTASFLFLAALAVLAFDVPFKGSLLALTAGAFVYVMAATALGLLISSFVRSQIAAIFAAAIGTTLPAVSFSGLTDPVENLQGVGRAIGEIYPTTHFLTMTRGAFSKALGFADLWPEFVPLLLAVPALVAAAALLLKKQQA